MGRGKRGRREEEEEEEEAGRGIQGNETRRRAEWTRRVTTGQRDTEREKNGKKRGDWMRAETGLDWMRLDEVSLIHG